VQAHTLLTKHAYDRYTSSRMKGSHVKAWYAQCIVRSDIHLPPNRGLAQARELPLRNNALLCRQVSMAAASRS
jgi:hypothetical protein